MSGVLSVPVSAGNAATRAPALSSALDQLNGDLRSPPRVLTHEDLRKEPGCFRFAALQLEADHRKYLVVLSSTLHFIGVLPVGPPGSAPIFADDAEGRLRANVNRARAMHKLHLTKQLTKFGQLQESLTLAVRQNTHVLVMAADGANAPAVVVANIPTTTEMSDEVVQRRVQEWDPWVFGRPKSGDPEALRGFILSHTPPHAYCPAHCRDELCYADAACELQLQVDRGVTGGGAAAVGGSAAHASATGTSPPVPAIAPCYHTCHDCKFRSATNSQRFSIGRTSAVPGGPLGATGAKVPSYFQQHLLPWPCRVHCWSHVTRDNVPLVGCSQACVQCCPISIEDAHAFPSSPPPTKRPRVDFDQAHPPAACVCPATAQYHSSPCPHAMDVGNLPEAEPVAGAVALGPPSVPLSTRTPATGRGATVDDPATVADAIAAPVSPSALSPVVSVSPIGVDVSAPAAVAAISSIGPEAAASAAVATSSSSPASESAAVDLPRVSVATPLAHTEPDLDPADDVDKDVIDCTWAEIHDMSS
jgi:hypothetical protein